MWEAPGSAGGCGPGARAMPERPRCARAGHPVADGVCRRWLSIDPPFGRCSPDHRPRWSKFGRGGRLYRTSTGRRHRSAMTDAELEAAADREALAAILEARGRDRQARAVLLEVLATLERVLGAEHYDVVGVLEWLASIAARCGDRADADALLVRALTIRRSVLGDEHVDILRTAAALARTQQECEDRAG